LIYRSKKIFITLITICFSLLSKEKPNIIFILADDMSFDSVSANNDKIGNMKTPNIDKLINNGMNFLDAHSGSSVCTPTRYGILTGRYCWRTKLKSSVLWDYAAPLIGDTELTVAELLKQQGYTTGMVGKWHLGMIWRDGNGQILNNDLQLSDAMFRPGDSKKRIKKVEASIDWKQKIGGPNDHGFDYFFGLDVPNFPPYTWIDNGFVVEKPSVQKPNNMFGHPGIMVDGWRLENILPELSRKSCDFIRRESNKSKPFFLYLSLTSPHTPISPSKSFQKISGISPYADFVIETDWVVGQVTQTLKDVNQLNNTLLIFTTDNGTSPKANFAELKKYGVDLHNNFKGQKAQIWEGGHRVPFVAHWPDKIRSGKINNTPICLNDFMATCAEISGFKLEDKHAVDSTSLLPLFMEKKLLNRPSIIHHDIVGRFSIRDGDWKCIFPLHKNEKYQLYNMKTDPKESRDLAEQMPEKVLSLGVKLQSYVKNGRSTPGQSQINWKNKNHWPGLPRND